jgi:hypothetical protein
VLVQHEDHPAPAALAAWSIGSRTHNRARRLVRGVGNNHGQLLAIMQRRRAGGADVCRGGQPGVPTGVQPGYRPRCCSPARAETRSKVTRAGYHPSCFGPSSSSWRSSPSSSSSWASAAAASDPRSFASAIGHLHNENGQHDPCAQERVVAGPTAVQCRARTYAIFGLMLTADRFASPRARTVHSAPASVHRL